MKGSNVGRRRLGLGPLVHWPSNPLESTNGFRAVGVGQIKTHLQCHNVRSSVISNKQRQQSALDLNQPKFKSCFCHFLPVGLEQSFKNLPGPQVRSQRWHLMGCSGSKRSRTQRAPGLTQGKHSRNVLQKDTLLPQSKQCFL